MRTPDPDEELVRRYLTGDPAAFASLVERHQTRMYNLALRVLGNPEDAADATQDAFLSALRKLKSFRGDAAFTTWMHRVTVNACYDLLRKRKRQPMLHVVGDDLPAPEPGPPAPDHADAVSGALDAAAALLRVPLDFRVVLVLADVQDMPFEEIAKMLDIPIGTVKSRAHRGRLHLAKAMGLRPAGGEPLGPPPTSKDTS